MQPMDIDSPPPNPRPRGVLDHTAYPHTIDAIVSLLSYKTLLGLRCTSKAMKTRVDTTLASHLVIQRGLAVPHGPKWDSMAGYLPRGLWLSTPPRRPPKCCINVSSIHGQLPGMVCDYDHMWQYPHTEPWEDVCEPQCRALRQHWESIFRRATKTIDVLQPWIDNSGRKALIRPDFDAVEIVRYYTHRALAGIESHPALLAPTVILFTTLHPSLAQCDIAHTLTGVFDGRVRRYVVHLTCPTDATDPTAYCPVILPRGDQGGRWLSELVIHFQPDPSAGYPQTRMCYRYLDYNCGYDINRSFTRDVGQYLAAGAKTLVTFVGAEDIPFQSLQLDIDPLSRPEREELATEVILKHLGKLGPVRIEEARRQLQFITRAEYRAAVGEEQWALETVPVEPRADW